MKTATIKKLEEMIKNEDMVFNLSINDRMISAINSNYHRDVKSVIESLECMELADSEQLEIWKADKSILASVILKNDDLEDVIELLQNSVKSNEYS